MESGMILATAGYDKQIKFWDMETWQAVDAKRFGDLAVNKLVLSADKRYLGACSNGLVKVYDLKMLDQTEVTFDGLSANAVAMVFQRQNKWFFVTCEDGTIKIFDFHTTGYQRQCDNGGVMIHCAVLHPNEVEIIFGDQSGEIKVWDLQAQKVRQFWQMDEPMVSITSLEIAHDASMLIMGNSAGVFSFWESEGVKALGSMDGGSSSNKSPTQVNYGTTDDFNPMQERLAHPD